MMDKGGDNKKKDDAQGEGSPMEEADADEADVGPGSPEQDEDDDDDEENDEDDEENEDEENDEDAQGERMMMRRGEVDKNFGNKDDAEGGKDGDKIHIHNINEKKEQEEIYGSPGSSPPSSDGYSKN
jgi:hypothetical protein